jgi:hypothetical protein
MVYVFLHIYEYEILKSVEVILRKGREKRENNKGNESNKTILYSFMEMSQSPLQQLYANINNTKKIVC